MTLDEWLTLSKLTNQQAAEAMNRLRGQLTPAQRAPTPQANEHRVSRLRLGRREVTPGEIVLVRALTDGLVTEEDWGEPPAPPAKSGDHRRAVYGIWIVFQNGDPLVETARLTQAHAWEAAGFEQPVDAVKLKLEGWECRLVARIRPTREMRRAARDK